MTDSAPDALTPAVEPRKAGRFSTSELTCSLGRIVNLCKDGMRVRARSAPRGEFTVEIADRGARVYIKAEVVWSKRVGLFTREYGLRFCNIPSDMVSKLARIAQAHSRRPSI